MEMDTHTIEVMNSLRELVSTNQIKAIKTGGGNVDVETFLSICDRLPLSQTELDEILFIPNEVYN